VKKSLMFCMVIPALLCGDDMLFDDIECRETDRQFDVFDAPTVEYDDHLWVPLMMIHSPYCPCEMDIFPRFLVNPAS